jgi:hypothetical protein
MSTDGPGQAYGLTNKQDKDAGDGATRAGDFPVEDSPKQARKGIDGSPAMTPEEHAEAYPLNYDLAARGEDSK